MRLLEAFYAVAGRYSSLEELQNMLNCIILAIYKVDSNTFIQNN